MSSGTKNKNPNFLLVVILAAASLLVVFGLTLFVLHRDHNLEPSAQPKPRVSELQAPPSPVTAPALRISYLASRILLYDVA
jgi:hypothetical protein